jgi:hypothetical protein
MWDPELLVPVLTVALFLVLAAYLAAALLFCVLLPKRDPQTYGRIGSPSLFEGAGGGLLRVVNQPTRVSPPLTTGDPILRMLLSLVRVFLCIVSILFFSLILASVVT